MSPGKRAIKLARRLAKRQLANEKLANTMTTRRRAETYFKTRDDGFA